MHHAYIWAKSTPNYTPLTFMPDTVRACVRTAASSYYWTDRELDRQTDATLRTDDGM